MSGVASRPEVVLVDGYNLLHAIPSFAPRGADLAPARERLEGWLAQAARQQRVSQCVLVWDGGGARKVRAPAPLTIRYTPKGISADERLLELCRERYAARAASTWVVSSDHGVQAPARELGFTVLGARTFYERWMPPRRGGGRGRLRSRKAADPDEKPRATRADVEDLLAEFLDQGDPGS